MPYTSLDDNFDGHPKVAPLSDAAFRLHISGILYCNRFLTDGVIQADDVPHLVRRFKPSALDELTASGLWASPNGQSTYLIHDFLDWNSSREEREARREAGRTGARARWSK